MVVQSRGPLWAIEPTGQQSLPQQQQQQQQPQQEEQEQQDQQLLQPKYHQQMQMQSEIPQQQLQPSQQNTKSQPEPLQQQTHTPPHPSQQKTPTQPELVQQQTQTQLQPELQLQAKSKPQQLDQQTTVEQVDLLQQQTHSQPSILQQQPQAHQELLQEIHAQPEQKQHDIYAQPELLLQKPHQAQPEQEHANTQSKLVLQKTTSQQVAVQSELGKSQQHLVQVLTESLPFEKTSPKQTLLGQPELGQVLAPQSRSSPNNEEPKTAHTQQTNELSQPQSVSVQSQQLQPQQISSPQALAHLTKPLEQIQEHGESQRVDPVQVPSQQLPPQQVLSQRTLTQLVQTPPQLLQSQHIQTLQTVPKPTATQLVLSQPTLPQSSPSVQPLTIHVQHQHSQQLQTKQLQLQQIPPQQVQTVEPKHQAVHTQQLQLHLTQVPAPQLSQLQVPQPKLPHLLVPQPQSNQSNHQPLLLQTQKQQQQQVPPPQQIVLKQKQLKQNFVPIQTQQSPNNSTKQPVLQQLKPSLTLQLHTHQLSQKQQPKAVLSLHRQNTQWKQHYKIVSDDQLVNSNYHELHKKVEVKKSFNFAVPAKKPPVRHSGMVEWKNTFNMRPVMLTTLRERRSQRGAPPGNLLPLGRGSSSDYVPVGAARSLDLLRTNLQNAINRDIQQVLNKYMERFFNPAMDNIRTNLGQESVVEDHVRVLCLRALEEAKLMYNSSKKRKRHDKFRSSRSHESRHHENRCKTDVSPSKLSKTSKPPQPISVQNGVSVKPNSVTNLTPPPGNLQQMYRKRKEMESEAEANRRKHARLVTTNNSGVDSASTNAPTESAVNSVTSGTGSGAVSGVNNGTLSGPANRVVNRTVNRVINGTSQGVASSACKVVSVSPIVLTSNAASPGTRVSPVLSVPSLSNNTSQASINYLTPKWDPDRITSDTLFVMGARANKVLGYGQTRGRLYSKHQELFKYPGDQEDKEWLTKNNFMTPNGGKAFLMMMQDIHELANTPEYRNNPNVMLHELKGFRAPDFMLRKIRSYMRNHRAEPLDDLSGLLDMELLPGLCEKEGGSLPLETSSNSTRSLLDAGVTDDSLIELALEYGVTLLGESETTSSTPHLTTSLTTLPPSLEALAPRTHALSRPVTTKSVSVSTSTSTPTSPQLRSPAAKGLNRSLSLPSSIAGNTLSGNVNFNSEQLIEIPLTPTPTIEELELLIKTESVGAAARGTRRPHNAILDSIDPQEDVFDHIMRAESKGDVGSLNADLDADLDASLDATLDAANLDENLDANLDASLDANLDLDVNLDMNLDSDGIGYLGLILEEDGSNQELNTPSHSPQTQDFSSMTQTDTLNSSGENSLAMSHATLSALLAGSTLDGLEIPEGLL